MCPMSTKKWAFVLCFFAAMNAFPFQFSLPQALDSHRVQKASWRIQLASFETETTDVITMPITLQALKKDSANHSLQLQPGPAAQWLKGWRVVKQPPLLSPGFKDNVATALKLRVDRDHLPYTYRRFKLCTVDEAGQISGTATIFLYFTPYNTVEVWNQDDFENLNRRWDGLRQNELPRQFVPRGELPEAAWSTSLFRGEEKPTRMWRTPGLAYAVPMKADAMPRPSATQAKNSYSGTLIGQVVTDVNGADLSIVDIAVELWESDVVNGDTYITTGFTGEDGLFSIDFSTTSPSVNGLPVYLVVASYNQSDLIRVRTRLGAIRSETNFGNVIPLFMPGNHVAGDVGVVEIDNHLAKPQLLHWANRAHQFVDSELPGVLPTGTSERLDIMRSFTGSEAAYFFPGGYVWDLIFASALIFGQAAPVAAALVGGTGAIFISNQDGIYFGEDEELNENTVYHEFGHYLMWHMQNESWVDILDASFAVHFVDLNNPNPKLSWSEGFANGFANIIDTWCQSDDGESGTEDLGNSVVGHYETRHLDSTLLQDLTNNLTHGFVSEYNNGTILYDLWDGPTQTLRDGTTLPNASDYDDGGLDNIELSFAQLMQPILNHQGTGGFHMEASIFGVTFGNDQEQYLLTDITEYHEALLDLPGMDCDAGRDITNLFSADYVSNFPPTTYLDQDRLTSDFLAFTRSVTTSTFDGDGNYNGTATHDYRVDVSELRQQDDEYNIAETTLNLDRFFLSDDLLVTGTPGLGSATLRFNGDMSFGWQDSGNSYGSAAVGGFSPTAPLDMDLCGNMTLEVNEGAKVVVGSQTGPPATVRLKSGSTLILGGDDSGQILDQELTYGTMVSMGTLIIRNGSRLIVEEGATLIFNRGGNIKLPGPNSILEIHGNLVVAEMANFRPDGNGKVIFDLPDLSGAPNVSVEKDAVITFFELDVQLLDQTYIRPDDDTSVRLFMQFGTASMGADSYIHAGTGPLYVEFMNVFPTNPQNFHQGLWVNSPINIIKDSQFSGCAPGVWNLHGTSPVVLRDCEFQQGVQAVRAESGGVNWVGGRARGFDFAGIDGRDATIYVEDVNLLNNSFGIHTDGGSGTLEKVNIFQGGGGWRALNPTGNLLLNESEIFSNAGSGVTVVGKYIEVTLSQCDLYQNRDGLRASGSMEVRLFCSEVSDNLENGLFMKDGARLDVGTAALFTASGNQVNLKLEDAAVPILNGGQNFWTTTGPAAFNIQGTIRGGNCECVLDIFGNCSPVWNFTNITGDLDFSNNTFNTPGAGQAIDITDVGTGNCSYVPTTTLATQVCPL